MVMGVFTVFMAGRCGGYTYALGSRMKACTHERECCNDYIMEKCFTVSHVQFLLLLGESVAGTNPH